MARLFRRNLKGHANGLWIQAIWPKQLLLKGISRLPLETPPGITFIDLIGHDE
ncbi:hypothetical protein U2F10_24805 [Leptothoe sp. EHU-05/26/07-4]|uniref:hypothetical protein n=1 Tax=Adonisia turfae TaxID=2950184 RepID=UPI0013D222BC|nr:hypothetical protein [Adonisia turfae]